MPGQVPPVVPGGPSPVSGPASVFQAAPSASPASPKQQFLAPGLLVLAALMVVGGIFLPLFRVVHSLAGAVAGAQAVVTTSAWGVRYEFAGQEVLDLPGAPLGVPLIVAVLLLGAGAVLGFLPGRRRASAWLGQAGTVFAAGVVLTIEMGGLGEASSAGDTQDRADLTTRLGMWLLIGGVLVAAAAVFIAYRATGHHGRRWADPAIAYADTETPPSGFPMPVVEPADGVSITVLPPEPAPEAEPGPEPAPEAEKQSSPWERP
jgi:hypothetical protein